MEKIDSKIILNEAGMAGLAFGAVSGGFTFIPATGIGWLLSIIKLVGLIWLMRWWMKRLCSSYEGVSSKDTLRFGTWTAFFSALITGMCFYVCAEFVNPEQIQEAIDTALQSGLAGQLDSNQTAALDDLAAKLPVYGLAANIIYCFIYGRILSLILSARIPGNNPFGKQDEAGGKDDLDDII